MKYKKNKEYIWYVLFDLLKKIADNNESLQTR